MERRFNEGLLIWAIQTTLSLVQAEGAAPVVSAKKAAEAALVSLVEPIGPFAGILFNKMACKSLSLTRNPPDQWCLCRGSITRVRMLELLAIV